MGAELVKGREKAAADTPKRTPDNSMSCPLMLSKRLGDACRALRGYIQCAGLLLPVGHQALQQEYSLLLAGQE